jgi:hypothetical protein
LISNDQRKSAVLCGEEFHQALTLASSSNAKILWIATRIKASTLAVSILLDGTELESNATSSAVAAEVIADCCGSHQ